MKIAKPWVSWEEFEEIVGGTWTPAAHTHEKADITDTPWAWADVLKAGSNLTDLATRQHAGLSDAPADAHHAQLHAASHHVAGADLLAFASIPDFGDWLDQAVKQASSPTFAGVIIDGGDISIKEAQKIVNADNASVHIQMPSSDVTTITNKALRFYDYVTSKYFQIDIPAGYVSFATDEGYYNFDKKIKSPTLEGNLHWDYITNEPTYYPPEYHYHVGRDIVSLHLVDLDDVEADDIFDVLPTAAIHGEGNYDWWGTWDVTAGAGCSVEIVVLAGDDKMLRLTDGSAVARAYVELAVDAPHVMVDSVIQFDMRQSANNVMGVVYFSGGGTNIFIKLDNDGNMKFYDGAATTVLQAYVANTWYKIRIHISCVAQSAIVFVDNVYNTRKTTTGINYMDTLMMRTDVGNTGYTFDMNNLKIFNLTI